MSIKVSSLVWQASQHRGSDLLVLLALADSANDQGVAWPAIPSIAHKARISERQAKRILAHLEADRVISIERGSGRTHASRYSINLDRLMGDIAVSPLEERKGDIWGHKV